MTGDYFLLIAGWILFGSIHSVLAASKIKRFAYEKLLINYLVYRRIYNVTSILTLALALFFQFRIESDFFYFLSPGVIVGAIFFMVVGLIFMAVSIRKYFRQMNIGEKGDLSDRLLINGIHNHVRHPLYAGTFSLIAGLFLLMPNLPNLVGAVAVILYTLIGMAFEERKLLKQFGSQYKAYKSRVPALFPDFKRKRTGSLE